MTWWIAIPFMWFLEWQWSWPAWGAIALGMLVVLLTPTCIDNWWNRQLERFRFPAVATLALYAALASVRFLLVAGSLPESPEAAGHFAVCALLATFLATWLYMGKPK